MLLSLLLAAAASTAAVSVPRALPVAARGLRCPGGGRAIGDHVGKSYILQELEIDARTTNPKLVGFVYSGADGNDYIDLSPSVPSERTRLMRDGEIDHLRMVMRYCFSEPWDGRTAAH